MLSRTVGLAFVASAITAQAFLLPPGIASADNPQDLSSWAIDTKSQLIKLPCSECAFSMKPEEKTEGADDDFVWIQGGANSVLLDFKVSDNGESMALNGHILYPPSQDSERAKVEQIASSTSLVEFKKGGSGRTLSVTGDTVFIAEEMVSTEGDSVIHVTYQILSLDRQPVSVDGVEVTMLKGTGEDLQILSVVPVAKAHSIFDSLPTPSAPKHIKGGPAKECSTLPAFMCKWKNVVENKYTDLKTGIPKHFKGCAGKTGPKKLPGHIKPHIHWEGDEADRPAHHHGRPPVVGNRPGRPHHGHHHHGHHHGHFMHRLLKGFVMVLIPVMAGITMGMTVSLIGMLVGRLIGFLWIKFRRGGQRGYASVALDEDESEKGEAVDQEAETLPAYEDAPAYEEVERK